MKILLATDGSNYNTTAVTEFACRPFPSGTQILVVSAYTHSSLLMSYGASMGTLVDYYARIDDAAKKYAEDAVENASAILHRNNAALIITTQVMQGSPKHTILEESKKFDADLIVVGSHGHGALESFLLGSVSQAVAMYANCSVEIMRSRNNATTQNK